MDNYQIARQAIEEEIQRLYKTKATDVKYKVGCLRRSLQSLRAAQRPPPTITE